MRIAKPPKPYHDLNVGGMKAARRPARGVWCDTLVARRRQPGVGGQKPTAPAQRENIEQLLAWGYEAEWIDTKQVLELEPDIDPAIIGDAPVAYFPEEGWLDPVVYANAMLSAARHRHGAKVICGARVADLLIMAAIVSPGCDLSTAPGTTRHGDQLRRPLDQ